MKIAFIIRSTLHTVPGGDTIQVLQTAKWLRKLGISVDLLLANSRIDYQSYDGFHFFNLNRPADILKHTRRISQPYFVTPILVDYSEYDKYHRRGLPGYVLRRFSAPANEYIKTVARWIRRKDSRPSADYIWKGHQKSMSVILDKAAAIFPNSLAEDNELKRTFRNEKPSTIVPNGIDVALFTPDEHTVRDEKLVICAARIEGIKNQLNLIKAMNDTAYTLLLIGSPAPNQLPYYEQCRAAASSNVHFEGHVSQEMLKTFYNKAKVHVLPSWFETCGLSSLEAAAMGCSVVVTDKGFTRDYFGTEAFYCDPGSPVAIRKAIEEAAKQDYSLVLQKKISTRFTWQKAAAGILDVYNKYC